MDKQILVAFASKYGATQEIASKVGEVLHQSGFQVDLQPAGRVRDVTRYQAVVLGSAVYIGRWPKEAEVFLKASEKDLAARPFWLFSSGPTGEGDPLELLNGWRVPVSMEPLVGRLQPRDAVVFHGNIDPTKVNRIEKWAVQNLVKKPLGDFRDWDMITAWSEIISKTLLGAE
jgi:menaquinone-dependent protoporphyrinogen oxidase